MLRYIYKILILCVVSLPVCGQSGKFIPKSVSAGFEVGNFLYSRIIEEVDFREFTGDVVINHFLLAADYGYARFTHNEQFHSYSAEGNYFRAGIDYNFIKKKNSPNVIFAGIRYGSAKFDEHVSYSSVNGIVNSNIWPEIMSNITKENVSGKWFELVSGIKVDIFKGIMLGFTARYKFLSSVKSQGTFANYYLPGYGKRIQGQGSNWGISYYLGYRLSF